VCAGARTRGQPDGSSESCSRAVPGDNSPAPVKSGPLPRSRDWGRLRGTHRFSAGGVRVVRWPRAGPRVRPRGGGPAAVQPRGVYRAPIFPGDAEGFPPGGRTEVRDGAAAWWISGTFPPARPPSRRRTNLRRGGAVRCCRSEVRLAESSAPRSFRRPTMEKAAAGDSARKTREPCRQPNPRPRHSSRQGCFRGQPKPNARKAEDHRRVMARRRWASAVVPHPPPPRQGAERQAKARATRPHSLGPTPGSGGVGVPVQGDPWSLSLAILLLVSRRAAWRLARNDDTATDAAVAMEEDFSTSGRPSSESFVNLAQVHRARLVPAGSPLIWAARRLCGGGEAVLFAARGELNYPGARRALPGLALPGGYVRRARPAPPPEPAFPPRARNSAATVLDGTGCSATVTSAFRRGRRRPGRGCRTTTSLAARADLRRRRVKHPAVHGTMTASASSRRLRGGSTFRHLRCTRSATRLRRWPRPRALHRLPSVYLGICRGHRPAGDPPRIRTGAT